MLVDNKFIYINLPRCGSTSFHYSCILHDLELKNMTDDWNNVNSKIDFKNIDEKTIMNVIGHGHERLPLLRKKFGYEYPIIAVKRDRHEAFYSLFKHVIFDLKRSNALGVYEYFKNMNLDQLFFFKSEDLSSPQKRLEAINNFLLRNGLIKQPVISSKQMTLYSNEYVVNIIDILITPFSHWHNHDKEIIWFDIKDLNKMEKWVSNMIGKPFKLKQVNSSQHIECDLKLDDNFKKRYNEVYDFYDLPKEKLTLI
jgi:hypothetical protein